MKKIDFHKIFGVLIFQTYPWLDVKNNFELIVTVFVVLIGSLSLSIAIKQAKIM